MSESLGTAELELRADGSGLDRDMARAESNAAASLDRAGRGMQRAGGALTKSVTGPIVALGTAIGLTGARFETQMSKIEGLVGLSKSEVNELGQSVLELAPKVGKGPGELSEALFTVTSAGFRGAEAMDVLEMAAKASAAGLGDTRSIAEAATGVINAYGAEVITAAEATDIVTATARAGNFETSELAGSLGRVTPNAQAAGASFADVGGAIALLTRRNNDARQSITQVDGVMRTFAAPTKQTQAALEELGLSTDDVRTMMSEKGLTGTLQHLNEELGGNQDKLREIIPDSQAFSGAMQILNADAGELDDTFGMVGDSVGITDEAFAAAEETARFKFDQAMAQVQKTMIKLSAEILPHVNQFLGRLADGIERVTEWWDRQSDATRQNIVRFAAVAAAVGPVLIVLGTLMRAAASVVTGLAGLGRAMMALGRFAGHAVMAVGRVVVAMATMTAHAVAAAARMVAQVAIKIAAWALMGAQALLHAAKIAAAWFIALGPVGWVIATVIALVALIIANWDKVVKWTRKAFDWVMDKIGAAWKWIKNTTSKAVGSVVGFFTNLRDRAVALVANLRDRAVAFFGNLRDRVASAAAGLRDRAVSAIATLKDRVIGFFGNIRDRLSAAANAARDRVMQAFASLVSGARDKVSGLVSFVRDLPGRIKSALGNLGSLLISAGSDLIRGLVSGIKNMAGAAGRAAKDAVKGAVDGAKSFLRIGSPSKLAAEQVGRPLVQGVQVGIDDEVPDLNARMSAAVNLDSISPRGPRLDGRGMGASGHGSVILQVDGRDLAEAVATEQVREIRLHSARG